jgi:hypothetical protein
MVIIRMLNCHIQVGIFDRHIISPSWICTYIKLHIIFGQLTGQLDKVVLECMSTTDKGRGMFSPNDISPASLVHVEEPFAAV